MMELSAAIASTGDYKTHPDAEVGINADEIAGLSGCLHYAVYHESCRVIRETIS